VHLGPLVGRERLQKIVDLANSLRPDVLVATGDIVDSELEKDGELVAMLAGVRDIEDISALVSEIESDHKGVPVLLRHYLRMNGNLLSFNIDPDFGQCLDGLIVVDLTRSEHKLLRVYLGVEGARSFLRYHNIPFDF
jgi:predicted MPP superfamily phosphohydrolase